MRRQAVEWTERKPNVRAVAQRRTPRCRSSDDDLSPAQVIQMHDAVVGLLGVLTSTYDLWGMWASRTELPYSYTVHVKSSCTVHAKSSCLME